MNVAKRTACLLLGGALGLAGVVPVTASADMHVFLGINLGGWFAPPFKVHTPSVSYAPPPAYYARPVYYRPRVVYTAPDGIDYRGRDHDRHRHWHDGWRDGWYRHGDHDWHHRSATGRRAQP